jgi:23S rRNA (adenine-N6)-dimethyltransferase
MVDIKYSQNFYINSKNLERIIDSIGLSSNDIVIDIGAGNGIITKELSKHVKEVIAYELDTEYFDVLKETFSNYSNISLKNEDFLKSELPKENFKVFSNIPFSLTSDIINKITDMESNLIDSYLYVQKESAYRFMGKPHNTQISTILSYRFSICILEEFEKEDFRPTPSVDIVLLNIKRIENMEDDFSLYRDFVTYIFNQRNGFVLDTFKKLFTEKQLNHMKNILREKGYTKPSDIPSEYYQGIFKYFKTNGEKYLNKVIGYYQKHNEQHIKREKVHRTRN